MAVKNIFKFAKSSSSAYVLLHFYSAKLTIEIFIENTGDSIANN